MAAFAGLLAGILTGATSSYMLSVGYRVLASLGGGIAGLIAAAGTGFGLLFGCVKLCCPEPVAADN